MILKFQVCLSCCVLSFRIPEDFITDFSSVVFGSRYVAHLELFMVFLSCGGNTSLNFTAAAVGGVLVLFIDVRLLLHPTSLCIRRRTAIEAATSQNDPHLPTLEDLKWRVDVTISTR